MLRAIAVAAAVALPLVAGAAPAPRRAAAPLEVTRAFYKALHASDAAAAARMTTGDTQPALAAFVRVAAALRRVEVALARRFGEEEAARIGYGNRVQAEVKELLGAEEEIEGDDARVVAADGRTLATLKRVGDAWKVELEEEMTSPEARPRLRREAEATEAAAKAVVPAIRAGKYRDAGAAVADFRERVAKASRPAAGDEGAEGVPL